MELVINSSVDNELDKQTSLEISKNETLFSNLTHSVLTKGADYVIKAMPINDSVKNVLLDVRSAMETKDFKEILKTAIKSSINEGLNVLSAPKKVIKDLSKIVDVSFKGGLREGVSAAIDIVSTKYLKNNLFFNVIKDFLDKTKDFVFSNAFKDKLVNAVSKVVNRIDNFKEKCNEWFKFYDKLDIENMNSTAQELSKARSQVSSDVECVKQNNVIQNMMKLINSKNEKLSDLQLQICNDL